MKLFRRFGLPERLLAILMVVMIVDLVANSILFDWTSSFKLREDDAERIAENLVLSSRALDRIAPQARDAAARRLSTPRFALEWSASGKRLPFPAGLPKLRAQILAAEPELARANLQLHIPDLKSQGKIGGAMRLSDDSVLMFHTHAQPAWTFSARSLLGLAFPSVLLIAITWLLVRAALTPLRTLIRATKDVGTAPPEVLPETGPEELRRLIRALNEMQGRVHQSIVDRTQTMLAIGHDLRTPISRMKLRLDDPALEPGIREEMFGDIDEMLHMLDSLQAYVESGGTNDVKPEPVDIAVMSATLVDTVTDHGATASYEGPANLEIIARPVAMRRALNNLIENAINYGGTARVSVASKENAVEIAIDDDGPGIPEDRIIDALQPFVRLDAARVRDTAGMGLGLAIVRRVVRREGGSLDLRNRPEGGLRATIRLPFKADGPGLQRSNNS